MLTTEPSLVNLTENATSVVGKHGDQYDARGAMYFTVATVCVYGLGIIFFIGSHISKREENKDEENQIERYLKSAPHFQYQKERDEVLRLRARWLANSLVGMPGASNYERRLSRAQRPIRLARVLGDDSSAGDTPLASPEVRTPDSSSVFPWLRLGRRMRRNACSFSFAPVPDEETEDRDSRTPYEPETPDVAAVSTPCESHHGGQDHEEGTEGSGDDTDKGACSLDTAASSGGDGSGCQEEEDQRMPFAWPGAQCPSGDFTDESPLVPGDRERQETSDVCDTDESNEDDDSSNDSEEHPRVKTRGSHSVCGSFLQQRERQSIPVILITSSSTPELSPHYSKRNLYPFFDRDGASGNDTTMPCDRSNAGDEDDFYGENIDNRGGPGGASGERRRRHGVHHASHPIYPHSHLSQPPFDPNQNASEDYNGNFQAAGDSSCEPSPGSDRDYSRLLTTGDVRRASHWSLPGRVTSRTRNDVRKVRDLGRRVMSTLLRIPGRLRGQSLSDPLLASPTSPSPPTLPTAQRPFEETMV